MELFFCDVNIIDIWHLCRLCRAKRLKFLYINLLWDFWLDDFDQWFNSYYYAVIYRFIDLCIMHNDNFSFFWILNFYHFESKKKMTQYYSAHYKLFFFLANSCEKCIAKSVTGILMSRTIFETRLFRSRTEEEIVVYHHAFFLHVAAQVECETVCAALSKWNHTSNREKIDASFTHIASPVSRRRLYNVIMFSSIKINPCRKLPNNVGYEKKKILAWF